jgi:dihydrofolate reductase
MRKIIEYTLVSADGVFTGPAIQQFLGYRDEAYFRDGLGQLLACDALLMGRTTYEIFAEIWPGRAAHPWAGRINGMKKYVFSSTLERAGWNNSVIVRGAAGTEVKKLKQEDGGDLLVYGHGLLAETLLRQQLLDVLDISVHPLMVGSGDLLFRPGQAVDMKLATVKAFTQIVKLTYEPRYES